MNKKTSKTLDEQSKILCKDFAKVIKKYKCDQKLFTEILCIIARTYALGANTAFASADIKKKLTDKQIFKVLKQIT